MLKSESRVGEACATRAPRLPLRNVGLLTSRATPGGGVRAPTRPSPTCVGSDILAGPAPLIVWRRVCDRCRSGLGGRALRRSGLGWRGDTGR